MLSSLKSKFSTLPKSVFWVSLLCFLGLLVSIIFHSIKFHGGDFKTYLAASTYLLDGKNPYTLLFIELADGNKQYFADYLYSPFFALLLTPLAILPWQLSLVIWYALNTWWLAAILKLSGRYLNIPKLSMARQVLFYTLSVLFLIRFIDHNYLLGQMTILLVYGSLYSVHLVEEKKPIPGALLLGFIATVKIVPGLLVFYLILRKQYKATLYTAIASLVFLLLPTVFVGFDNNLWLHQEWFNTISPFNKKYLLETKSGLFNLSAWVPALFSQMPSDSNLGLQRNLLNLSYETTHHITQVLRLAFVAFTFYFFRRSLVKPGWPSLGKYWSLSYVLLITPLIFPRQSKYAYVYLLPAACYLIAYLLHQRKTHFWKHNRALLIGLGTAWAMFTLTSVNLVGRYWYNVFQDFKVITYGCFVLMALLAAIRPWRAANDKEQAVG